MEIKNYIRQDISKTQKLRNVKDYLEWRDRVFSAYNHHGWRYPNYDEKNYYHDPVKGYNYDYSYYRIFNIDNKHLKYYINWFNKFKEKYNLETYDYEQKSYIKKINITLNYINKFEKNLINEYNNINENLKKNISNNFIISIRNKMFSEHIIKLWGFDININYFVDKFDIYKHYINIKYELIDISVKINNIIEDEYDN